MNKQLVYLFTTALLLMVGITTTQAQTAAQCHFSASSGTYTPLVGGTVIIGNFSDDDFVNNTPIGFSFKFAGTNYTHVNASTNGFLVLATAIGANNLTDGHANNTTFTSISHYPIIAPLWDDLMTGMGTVSDLGAVSSQLSGVSPNQVLTVQWKDMWWDINAGLPVISFQAKLYEGSNKIEYIYKQEGEPVNPANGGATIGICSAAGVFLSLNNTGASPTASSTIETSAILTKPATGQVYTFSSSPTVSTQAVSSIEATTAIGNGNITSLGVFNPTQYGVVWSTSTNPTVALSTKTTQGAIAATGAFTSSITGLTSNTTYYVKAYATNAGGTAYGAEVSFTANSVTALYEESQPKVALYPNPSSDKIALVGFSNKASVEISNIAGKVQFRTSVAANETVSIESLASGVYFAKIVSQGKMSVVRFIKTDK